MQVDLKNYFGVWPWKYDDYVIVERNGYCDFYIIGPRREKIGEVECR